MGFRLDTWLELTPRRGGLYTCPCGIESITEIVFSGVFSKASELLQGA